MLKQPKYAMFERVIFDTAPTGHTLRLLTLPDFFENIIGKIVLLKSKINSATDILPDILKKDKKEDTLITKLEQTKVIK